MTYLRYTPELETTSTEELKLFNEIAETFAKTGEKVAAKEGRAVRVSHAKATAVLEAETIVDAGLPAELAQGLAARPCLYKTTIRFAQGPGENLHDRISTHRGMAIKIHGLEGESIPESVEPATQDFVLEAHTKALLNADAKRFLANLKAGVSHAPSLSEGVKNAVSNVSRAAEATLEAVGLESKTLGFFGHPSVHPLSEGYFSQVPMRWGDYVAKIGVYPTQATLDSLAQLKIDARDDHDAFRTALIEHFSNHGAEFEIRAQLATDVESTPIEDAAKEWPEKENPYRKVARIVIGPQPAWTPARDAYAERLSFRPANSLTLHRPLGQIMRARLYVYGKLADWRRQKSGHTPTTPAQEAMPA